MMNKFKSVYKKVQDIQPSQHRHQHLGLRARSIVFTDTRSYIDKTIRTARRNIRDAYLKRTIKNWDGISLGL